MAGSTYTLYYDNAAPDAQTIVATGGMSLNAGNVYAAADDQPSGGPQFYSAGISSVNLEFTFGTSVSIRHIGLAGLYGMSGFGTIKAAYDNGAGSWIGVGSIVPDTLHPAGYLVAGRGQCGVSGPLTSGASTRWRLEMKPGVVGALTVGEAYLFQRDAYDVTPEYQTVRRYIPNTRHVETDGGIVYGRQFGSVVLVDELHYDVRSGANSKALGLAQVLSHPRMHRGMIVEASALYPQHIVGLGVPLPYDRESYDLAHVGGNDGTIYPARFWDNDGGYSVTYTTYGQFAFTPVTLRMDLQ